MKYYVNVRRTVICWYKDSAMTLWHKVDGPAVEYADGSNEWYINGKRHREGGPAVEYADGFKEWYKHGKLHREDGPAVIFSNGTKVWCLEDVDYTETEFNEKMKPVIELTMADIEKLLGKKVKIVK
jgi:hypothetical protein